MSRRGWEFPLNIYPYRICNTTLTLFHHKNKDNIRPPHCVFLPFTIKI